MSLAIIDIYQLSPKSYETYNLQQEGKETECSATYQVFKTSNIENKTKFFSVQLG